MRPSPQAACSVNYVTVKSDAFNSVKKLGEPSIADKHIVR